MYDYTGGTYMDDQEAVYETQEAKARKAEEERQRRAKERQLYELMLIGINLKKITKAPKTPREEYEAMLRNAY